MAQSPIGANKVLVRDNVNCDSDTPSSLKRNNELIFKKTNIVQPLLLENIDTIVSLGNQILMYCCPIDNRVKLSILINICTV